MSRGACGPAVGLELEALDHAEGAEAEVHRRRRGCQATVTPTRSITADELTLVRGR